MRVTCAVDGRAFEAKRATARYCSDRCRKQAQRRPKVQPNVFSLHSPSVPVEGGLTAATRRELEAAGRSDSALGMAALFIAQRIDGVGLVDTGAGVAALVKEHRTALAEAVKDVDGVKDALDDIRESAALKLIGA